MALRLSGEEFSIVRGLDDYGWLKEVRRTAVGAALVVRQEGSGPVLELKKGATTWVEFNSDPSMTVYGPIRGYGGLSIQTSAGGDIVLGDYGAVAVDVRVPLANKGGGNSGNVAVAAADEVEMLGNQKGVIVRTSSGVRYRIRVDDSGAVTTDAV